MRDDMPPILKALMCKYIVIRGMKGNDYEEFKNVPVFFSHDGMMLIFTLNTVRAVPRERLWEAMFAHEDKINGCMFHICLNTVNEAMREKWIEMGVLVNDGKEEPRREIL